MNKIFIVIVSLLILSGCATNKKFEKATCQEIHGLFTKSISCLELKFLKINPKKYEKYETSHNLILESLADQVYQNKISNAQVWLIYEDIISDFKKSKKKEDFLLSVLSRYS